MRRLTGLALLAAAPLAVAAPAQSLYEYTDADLALGSRLLREHACTACHVRRVGGDGTAIYRPGGRVNTPSALVSMVERCNTELGLQFFPEDVVSIAAVLQRDHYRFLVSKPARQP
jgi:hypothetical protein